MMKRKASLAVLLAVLLLIAPAAGGPFRSQAAAQDPIEIIVRGTTLALSTPAFIENGSAVVPLREIAEALGADVVFAADSAGKQAITLKLEERSATLSIGKADMTANGKNVRLDAPARLFNNVTMVPLRALSESLGAVVAWDGIKRIITIDDPLELPVIGSKEKLRELMEFASSQGNYGILVRGIAAEENAAVVKTDTMEDAAASAPAATESQSESKAETGYSQTNVQTSGVDEADWAKTDGRFIYQLSGSRVLIADIADPAKPKLAAALDYPEKAGFYPQELYVDNKQLIVIGQHSVNLPYAAANSSSSSSSSEDVSSNRSTNSEDLAVSSSDEKMGISLPVTARSTVKTFIYELSDTGQPKLVRETEQEGSYISSRKIGSALYIVTNKYNYMYPVYADGSNASTDVDLARSFEPVYRDSASSTELQTVTLDTIRYFPESQDSSTMLVGALDLDFPEQPLQVSAYLGSGQTIYASEKHLYIAIESYIGDGDTYKQETRIHKFRLDQGRVVYLGEGSVPGSPLNQFSMDEHDGYFRIAVTKGNMWDSGEGGSTNNLYVLDEKLKTIGKLEGLAPGERIYSVRFMGGRAYMVTFRSVDPLFAIDLNNPMKPAVLGQLKIPGYSDYLHPYDENHLIGFGKETVELTSKSSGTAETTAFYQGMKIALFDVSDVSHPKEKFKEVIGDRGTDSELLRNHKALLFSKEKGLLAFPVELHEIKNKDKLDADSFPAYGEFTYQGAYVYRIDLEKGFTLRGRVTHLTDEDLLKSGQYGYDNSKSVQRILYAGDTLYTLSNAMLKANDINSLKERGALTYPALPEQVTGYPNGPLIQPMPNIAE